MQKVYLDKITGNQIIDVSGEKSLAEIKAEFGDVLYEQVTLVEGESHRIDEDGDLEKFDLATEVSTTREAQIQAMKVAKDFSEFRLALFTYMGIK